jgi:hypothetical protein
MRTYKEYLIPEIIDHKELRYLVSIGSKVLVNYNHRFMGNIIVELIPDDSIMTNSDFNPLSNSDIYFLERNMVNIHFKLYKIN